MKLKFITAFLTLLSSVAYGSYPCKIRFKSSITLTNATITILKNDIIGVVESRKLDIADGTVYNLDINQPVVIASLSGIYKNKPYFFKFLLDSGDNQLMIEPSFKNFNVSKTSISNLLYNKYEAILKGGTYSTNGVTSNLEQTFDNCLKYINDNKSYVTLIALYQLSKMEADRKSSEAVLKVLNQLPPELKSTSLANEILEREQRIIRGKERAANGMVVPSFSVPNLKGEMISNSSLAGKNYVIAFSATWCGPCQAQLPKLKRIYGQYRNMV